MDADEIKYEALKELGYTEEPNFSADNDNAVNAINGSYERQYNLALTSYDWSFAKQKTGLTANAATGKYKYYYVLPTDCIYLRELCSDSEYNNHIYLYERNGEYIYTDSPSLYVTYTKKICEDELPAYFTEYFIYSLARKNCTKITGDQNLLQEMLQNEQTAYSVAKNTDIKQQEIRILPTGAFINVRN